MNETLSKRDILWFLRFICLSFLSLLPVTRAYQVADTGTAQSADLRVWKETVEELLQKLSQNGSLPPPSPEKRRVLLEALVQALTVDGKLLSEPPPATNAPAGKMEVYSEVICGKADEAPSFLYLRASGIEAETPTALKNKLASVNAVLQGTILDLRKTSGNGIAAVGGSAAVLDGLNVPLVVLADGSTSRAAEALTHELRERCGAVVLGEATKGVPFAARSVILSSGEKIRISNTNSDGNAPSHPLPDPILPDVPIATNTTASPAQGNVSPSSRVKDGGVRRAVDLLTAIWALDVLPDTVPTPHPDEKAE